MNYACDSKIFKASAICYPRALPPNEKLLGINAPMLIVYGDRDQVVKMEEMRELETRLKRLKKDVQFDIYPGAQHAFFNETGPNYGKTAAESAWKNTTSFLGVHLPVPKL